jgi:hypothetical protein
MVGKIEPRYGAEVYVGDLYDVCIKQAQPGNDHVVVILGRDEVKSLIPLLQAAIKRSEELEQEEAENE